MKSFISQSIILRVKEFGESDLLVTFFSSEKGLLKGVAKGARKSRKRFVNCLDLFCLVNLEYEERGNRDLCFLLSGKHIDAYEGLRHDYSVLSKASVMVELVELLFPYGVYEKDVFRLLKDSLESMAKGENADIVFTLFEI